MKKQKKCYVAADIWIKNLNINSESLHDCYIHGEPRNYAYDRMVERILSYVRRGLNVCVVFYGHPGVHPGHESIRRACMEGFSACILPGIRLRTTSSPNLGLIHPRTVVKALKPPIFLCINENLIIGLL